MNNYNFMLIYTNFNNNIFITKAKKNKKKVEVNISYFNKTQKEYLSVIRAIR